MRRKLQIVLIFTLSMVWLILPQGVCLGADYCVRSGATGNNDGSDWTNAWDDLPASLTRGDTYYIADGTYGRHNFNDAVDGEKYIYIKKAIESDHGTDTGWQSSYGDGQAVFTAATGFQPTNYCLAFRTSYWIVNGQVGGGPDDWKGSINPLGFKVTGPMDDDTRNYYLVSIGGWTDSLNANYVELHHVEITAEGFGPAPEDANADNPYRPFGVHSAINSTEQTLDSNGSSNGLIKNCWFHHNTINIYIASNKDWVIEENFFSNNIDDIYGTPFQQNGMKAYNSHGLTIRYNLWENQNGSGTIWLCVGNQLGTTLDIDLRDVYIYGNVFYNNDGLGNNVGTICVAPDTSENDLIDNLNVYNNTFINLYGVNTNCGIRVDLDGDPSRIGTLTNFRVYNNLFYDVDHDSTKERFFEGVTDRGYNWFYDCDMGNGIFHENVDEWLASGETDGQVGTADPFVDWVNKDFRLSAATNAGINFSWMDNKDMFGNTRGADGVWDRGAYEYVPEQDHEQPQPEDLPDKTSLECYNNVFNPIKGEEALIIVNLPKQARVKISLYNTRGNKIRQLTDKKEDAGPHKYHWDGKNDSGNVVGSGLYFVHIQVGDYKKTKKIVVVK